MKTHDYILKSFINAGCTFAYISLVAWFMSNGERLFGGGEDTFVIPIFMLLLFVISASITGFLVLGKPITLFIDGQKKEAFALLFATLAWLVVFLVIIILSLLLG